ncbi:MAG: hypothetical protein Q8R60_17240 [Mycobacteriales bacterium]|nr:hypothetical protein [Mycobacteriales bacterium]
MHLRTPLPALALALTATLLAGCGDGGSTVATPPTTGTATAPPSATPSATSVAVPSSDVDQDISLTYAAGKVTGDTGRVTVTLGSKVRIVVTSDVAEELHLHVYDVKKVVTPGQPTEVLFTADVPGQVELELEQSRTTLVRLVIS